MCMCVYIQVLPTHTLFPVVDFYKLMLQALFDGQFARVETVLDKLLPTRCQSVPGISAALIVVHVERHSSRTFLTMFN